MTIGQRIQSLRKQKGLTQSELGKMIDKNYTAISKYERDDNEIPSETLKDIAIILGVSTDHLLGLETLKNKNKDIITDVVQIPIVGKISAGIPIMAVENIEGYQFFPKSTLSSDKEYFFLRVNGDSMNLKFNDGDLVLVQKQDVLENGEIGVIRINGYDATLKKFKREDNLVILEPMSTNPANTFQIYNPEKIDINIIGKVIWYMGKV